MFKHLTFSTDSKFDKWFNCFVVECKFMEKSLFYDWSHMHRAREHRQTWFFPQIHPITQTTVIEYAM